MCELCDTLNNRFIKLHSGIIFPDIVLYENDSFTVIPDRLPIAPCHSLLISKSCVCGMAGLFEDDLEKLETEVALYDDIFFRKTGQKISHLEHGSVNPEGKAGNSIFHFHLHNILLPYDIRNDIAEKTGKDAIPIRKFKELAGRKEDYLLYCSCDGSRYIYNVDKKLPSQFLRQLIFQMTKTQMGNLTYDWKSYDNTENFRRNYEDLRRILK